MRIINPPLASRRFVGGIQRPTIPIGNVQDAFMSVHTIPSAPRFGSGKYLQVNTGGMDHKKGEFIYLSAPQSIRLEDTNATGQVESGESIRARNCKVLGKLIAPDDVRLENCGSVQSIAANDYANLLNTTVHGDINVIDPGKNDIYHLKRVDIQGGEVKGLIMADDAIIKSATIHTLYAQNTADIQGSIIIGKADIRNTKLKMRNCPQVEEVCSQNDADISHSSLNKVSALGQLEMNYCTVKENASCGQGSSLNKTSVGGLLYSSASNLDITDCRLQNVLIGNVRGYNEGTPNKPPVAILNLDKDTVVNGDITFEFTPGIVYTEAGTVIKGKVINGTVIRVDDVSHAGPPAGETPAVPVAAPQSALEK